VAYFLEAAYDSEHEPATLRKPEEIDAFIKELLAAGTEPIAATVYAIDEATNADPDHELVVGVRPGSDLGALRYAGEDGDWYSLGEQARPDGLEFAYFGTATEFPADAEVSLGIVRAALCEMLTNGGARPTRALWQSGE
jgi:Immunity protein Imm1